jgi:transcriptional regulator with XRE-family HTH domain
MSVTLGHTIRQARKARGWSLKSFSEKIGISIMTLQRIETGQVSPSVKLMIEIAATLERPITDFIKDRERTLIRLKANKIKGSDEGRMHLEAIYPEGVIEPQLGLNLAEVEPGQAGEWSTEDYYKGYHVLSGGIIVEFEDKKATVKEGETVYFDGRKKHRLASSSGAQVVIVFRR